MALAIALAVMAQTAAHKMPAGKQLAPLGQYRSWFSAKDYPREAMIARQQGRVDFELDVDGSGLPSDCRILRTSGVKALDERTCTVLMSRARFRPIKDRKGRGVPQKFRHSFVWKLPGRSQEKTVDRSFDAKAVVTATGEVESCKLSGAGASKIATAGGSCGPFGNKDFLLFFLKEDYAKVRATNVRMSIVFNGSPLPALDRPPNVLKEIAKSSIDISPAGEMTACTAVTKMEALGRSMDLCDFVRADPPRFPSAPGARKASIVLDLAAYY